MHKDTSPPAKRTLTSRRSRSRAMLLLALFGCFYVVVCGLLAWETVRPKHEAPSTTPLAQKMAFEQIEVTSPDGTRLRGWYIPANERIQKRRSKGIVICCHGVDSTRLDLLPSAKILYDAGYSVVLFDFRARGISEGALCTLGYRESDDLLAVIHAIQSRPELGKARIGLLGESMGGAVALMGAARCPDVRCVIAESPYARLDHAVANHFRSVLGAAGMALGVPTRWIGERLIGKNCADIAPVTEIARIVPRPLLLIADDADTLCPTEETQALYQAAGEPKVLWTVAGADHIGAQWVARQEYAQRITAFFDAHLAQPTVTDGRK